MKIGGYKIIDLMGLDISTSKTIPGIYDAIEESKKPILLSGINIGTEQKDIFAEVGVSGTDFVIKCYGGTITIDDDNAVIWEEDEAPEVIE